MQAKTISASNLESLKSKLESFDQFKPTLSVCFSSIIFDSNKVQEVFNSVNIPFVAFSSAGEITNQDVTNSSISVMLFDMPTDTFRICSEPINDRTIYQSAFDLGNKAATYFDNSAMIICCSKYGLDGQSVINGINDAFQKDIPIFGGLAANDQGNDKVWACCSDGVYADGMVCIVFDNDKIEVNGMATSGWEPIGIPHTITKATGNQVEQINGRPALDVFIDYFGFFEDASATNTDTHKMISGQYPFQIEKDSGESVLRSPIIADLENRSLIMGGSVEQGQNFRFSASPGFEVINKTVKEFDSFAREDASKADALLLFSCIGRHAALGPLIEDELTGIQKAWNAPMIGAFTLGEIGKTRNGNCEFHNITSSLVLLKEK